MKIFVVGAKGQLSKEIKRQFQQKYELFLHGTDTLIKSIQL